MLFSANQRLDISSISGPTAPSHAMVTPQVVPVFLHVCPERLGRLPVLLKLGFVGLDLGFAGVIRSVGSQLLLVQLNLLLVLLQLLAIRFQVLLVVLDVVAKRGIGCSGWAGGRGLRGLCDY